jgi:hypothetical protein
VTVAGGQKSVTIGIPSNPVLTNTPVTLSASSNGAVAATATITVDAPVVTSVVPLVTTAVGPSSTYALVVLTGAAATGFSVLGSLSNSSVISVPSTVSFTGGLSYAWVPLTISAVTKSTAVTITVGGKTCTITVLP